MFPNATVLIALEPEKRNNPIFLLLYCTTILTQGHKSGRSVTGSTVSDGGVRDRELTQVVANHLGLDLNSVENLAVVHTDDGADHFGDNNHVSQVSLDDSGLLVLLSGQLSSSQLLDQTHGLGTQTSRESSSHSSTAELGELFVLHLDKVLKVNTLEGEGLEHSVLLSCYC